MSYIDMLEDIVDEVSTWANGIIYQVLGTISPDGRPFGMEKATNADRLREYMQLRGNEEAWLKFLLFQAEQMMSELQSNGVPEDEIMAIRPMEIAIAMASKYSAEMEEILGAS